MNIAEWTIRNRVTSIAAFVCIALYGIYTYMTIPMQEDPDFVMRTALVTTQFPGAPPSRVEELVTDKLEKRIREMAEIDYVTSQSRAGVSIISVNIREDLKDMQPIWQRLRNKVEDAASSLPDEAGAPVVNDEFGDVFGFLVALTGDGYTYREMKDAADDVRNTFLQVDGVSKVELWGVQDERVFVEISNARFAELGITPFLLADAIKSQNTVRSSGRLKDGPELWNIRSTGAFMDVDDLRQMSLRMPGGKESMALMDLASIKRGFTDPPSDMVRYNGKSCIMLAVSMAVGNNIVKVGTHLTEAMDDAEIVLPVGLELEYAIYTPTYVKDTVHDFLINLAQAFGFVVIVLLFFVGLRTGVICGTLVPMAMLACLALMPTFGVFLQRISIASMIIALGILVDNGVVVSEEILVRLARGEDRMKAVAATVRGLAFPLLAASLTTIFAFLPIPLAPSATGEYCVSLFIVISLTLAASWVFSLTMVPMMSYALLKPKLQEQDFSGAAYQTYRVLLKGVIRFRWVTLAVVVGLCWTALWAFKFVPSQFMPPNERAQFLIDFKQPYGTDIRTTSERVAHLEKIIMEDEAFDSLITFVGSGGPRWYLPLDIEQPADHLATMVVNIRSFDDLQPILERLDAELAANYPDTRYRLKEMMMGPPAGAAIQVRIAGGDMDTLYRLRARVVRELLDVGGTNTPWDDWGEWTKQVVVDVDQNKARYSGLTSEDIAMSLQMQLSSLRVSDFREGEEVIPIVLRSDEAVRDHPEKLVGLNVYSFSSDYSAPLIQVANMFLEWQPSNVRRRDQMRTMTIMADTVGRLSSEVLQDLQPRLDKFMASDEWPAGYTLEYGGEQEKSADAMASITANMPLALMLLFLVLVAQFNSLKKPLIVILTLPPMVIGITPGMIIADQNFTFMAFLGMISLLGIIVNNAIMLLDCIGNFEREGKSKGEAVIQAGLQRARPIVMTTITTIVGLVPLIISGGGLWRPLAVLMVSGLAVATALTLILCPVLYSVFFSVKLEKAE